MIKSTKIFETYTDEALLAAMKENQTDAFAALYQRHVDHLYRTAWKRLQSKAAADDMVQEVFVNFYERRHTIDVPVKPYLMASLKNRIINEFRNRLIHETHHAAIAATQKQHSLPHTGIDSKTLQLRFRQTLEKMPPKCREVFELSRFESMPNKSIAEKLGISVNTVEKHMGKALAILKKELSVHELGLALLLLSHL
ncbi:RNA polymerase sigma-70 factor [Chitinophaga solisilvae]|uniref:RNA polymerase sigma-70 factor n=1 Tax=Chitinophaga solisilvae TaxID=1233460 RepID=A0A3S1CUD6_9BACT|nr:RNA polymerase sigma-70 factor [Chitinophaga solisilvae]NSL86423.1 RNA polymerase sigma-70 factor [Chitinophaga solisilvae]